MADIIDIFKNKHKVPPPPQTIEQEELSYYHRMKKCLETAATDGQCGCELCVDKKDLSNKVLQSVLHICEEYSNSTGTIIYVPDALEVVLSVAARLKQEILQT